MNKAILRLAIPNIISNISVPLLSTVDIIFMGTLTPAHLGAVGIGAMIFNFLFWNFGFLRMGSTGMTAQAFGARSFTGVRNVLYRSLLASGGIAVILLAMSPLMAVAGFYLMNVSAELEPLVRTYFFIMLVGLPATLTLFSMKGWFFGMQNALYPLWITIVINLINIGLSYYLVMILGLGIAGVAWGTVIAQYAGLTMAMLLLRHKYREYARLPADLTWMKWSGMKHFFKVNRDIFLRTMALSLVFSMVYSQSARYGELVLAANVILLQLLNWMSYGIDGFAYAAESLTGKFAGSGDQLSLKEVIRRSIGWGLVLALLYTALYGLLGDNILMLFSRESEILAIARHYLPWMLLIPLIGFLSYIWDGIYVGLMASGAMRDTMLVSFAVFILAYFLLAPGLDNHALWLSLAIFLLSRGVLQTWYYFRFRLSEKHTLHPDE